MRWKIIIKVYQVGYHLSIRTLSTLIFWVIKQLVVVIRHRRFGTTYRFHLQGSRNKEITHQFPLCISGAFKYILLFSCTLRVRN